MHVLVIGGTGVLGREVLPAFINEGYVVSVISDGKGPSAPSYGVAEHIIVDRNDQNQLVTALSHSVAKGWDAIIDLICYTPKQASTLLDSIGERCSNYLIVSSTFVYAPRAALPYFENSPVGTLELLGGYPAGKLAMEDVWRTKAPSATIVRLPHVIAPGGLPGAVPLHARDRHLVQRLRNSWPIWMVNSGNQSLSFVDGRDVASVFVKLINGGYFGHTLNLAHPTPITGSEYINVLATALRTTADVRSVPSALYIESGWGWTLSATSRFCDTSKIAALVPHKYFDLSDSLQNCLPLWESTSATLENDPLEILRGIDFDNQQYALEVLRKLAKERLREGVDLRMNTYPLPITTAGDKQ